MFPGKYSKLNLTKEMGDQKTKIYLVYWSGKQAKCNLSIKDILLKSHLLSNNIHIIFVQRLLKKVLLYQIQKNIRLKFFHILKY